MTNRRLAVPVLALVIAATLLLSGCGPINAGSAAGDHFTAYMSDEPGVADVQVSSSNNLPFYGSADATIVLDEGADDETLAAVVDRMAEYLRDHSESRVSWSMIAEVDGFSIGVSQSDDTNSATIGLLGQARAIEGIVGGWLYSANGVSEDMTYFVVEDPAQFIATLGQLLLLDFLGYVEVHDAGSTFAVTSTGDGELPAPEIAAYEAVAAAYTIRSADLEPGSVELRVGGDDQVAGATEIAKSLPGSAGIEFDITGGIVTRSGEGDFTLVNGIIVQLIDIPGVAAVYAEPDVLGVTVSTFEAVVAAQSLLEDTDGSAALTAYYRSEDGMTPGFSIYGGPERRATFIPVVGALIDGGYLDDIEILADRLDITAGPYDEQRMTAFAVALKGLLPEREHVRLTNSTGGLNFWFITGEVIDVEKDNKGEDRSYGAVAPDAFVEAWNAAP